MVHTRRTQPALRIVWDETAATAERIDEATRRSDYSPRFNWHPILGGEARIYVQREAPQSSSWEILNPGDAVVRTGSDQDDWLTVEHQEERDNDPTT